MYDRNQYTIKYVYIYVLTIPYSEKYLAEKKTRKAGLISIYGFAYLARE